MQSHDHGYGRFRRAAWGAKEDCKQCMEAEKRMAEARAAYKSKRRCLCGSDLQDGDAYQCKACQAVHSPQPKDVDYANTIIGKDERPSFAYEIAIMLIIASMFTYIGITNARNGDAKAADTVRFVEVR